MTVKFKQLVSKLQGISCKTNKERRVLYSKVGLLELDIIEKEGLDAPNADEKEELLSKLHVIAKDLDLHFIELGSGLLWKLVNFVDDAVRILCTWTFMLDFCIFACPFVVLYDAIFPGQQITALGRKFVSDICLKMCGVRLDVEGKTDGSFDSHVSMLAFTHASTMDAFILGSVVPCSTYTLSKRELFIIPFFGWLLAMGGGVAIDRSNREQATCALKAAVNAGRRRATLTSNGKGSAVSISPEGTRSKTGQLLDFKKGPFYVWEDLNEAVVPLIIFGAYDLYGQDKSMSTAGRVVARFLKPIKPTEIDTNEEPAKRRELMSRLLRRRMLEAGLDSPDGVGDEGGIGYSQRLSNYVALLACVGFNVAIFKTTKTLLDGYEISQGKAALAGLGTTIGLSVLNYMYNVRWGSRRKQD
jgi:1-acyl-sn-glycerol-3-phosphate acyltransferase